jgi:probable O-glycosylation ligase (exosortase A-associated)
MPFRDLALLITVMALLPACVVRPWVGVLVWSWLGYMNPHRLTWSVAYDIPFSLMVAIATLIGFVFTSERQRLVWSREVVAFLALWLWFGITTVFAVYPDAAMEKFLEFSKIMVMVGLVVPLFQDRRKLRLLFVVIAASLGFYGVKGGLFVLQTGGQWTVLGPPGSFFEANTELALVLNMALPLILYLAREETHLWRRRFLWAAFVLTLLAVPFTYSRGGVLGLAVVLTILFLRARRRLVWVPVIAAGLLAFALFTPAQWVSRVQTIEDYEADESAQLRFMSWRVAMMIAADRPVVGGGFRVFLNRATYDMYLPEYPRAFGHDAHSIYFNLLGEHGWVGLGLFVLLVGSSLLTLSRIRRLAKANPEVAWAGNYAHMIQASLAAFLVTGVFISAAYFDLAYQLLVMIPVLHVVAVQELAAGQSNPAALPAPGATPMPAGAK